MSAPEDLVNQALREVGYPYYVQSLYDGSPAAKAALEVYRQTRQELLDAGDWPFARRANVALSLLKGPPPPGGYNPAQPWSTAYPPPGWLYEYTYPEDCLDFRAVLHPPGAMFQLDPRPAVWRIDNDHSFAPARKVILSNVKGALAVYIGDIPDPDLWEPGFARAVVKDLAAKLAKALPGNLDLAKENLAEAALAERANERRG